MSDDDDDDDETLEAIELLSTLASVYIMLRSSEVYNNTPKLQLDTFVYRNILFEAVLCHAISSRRA